MNITGSENSPSVDPLRRSMIENREFAIGYFCLNAMIVAGLFMWGWRSVVFMCFLTGVSFFIGKWLTRRRGLHFLAAQSGTFAVLLGVCLVNLPRGYLIELQTTIGEHETIVRVTNVESVKNDCPTFVNVVGYVRTINPQGEFRDLPITWASWSPGETKQVTVTNPFAVISRIEFHAQDSQAAGFFFSRDLAAHWPLTPDESATAKLDAELRDLNNQ